MTKTYETFIEEVISEKITLAHVHCKWRAFTFTNYSGNIQQKTMDHFVSDVDQDSVSLTKAADRDSVIEGTFFFDITTNILYVYSTDITISEVIVTFRFFFSNAPISLSNDLTDSGAEVYYEPRITSTSGVDVKVSEDVKGLALIGNGKIVLETSDGFFNSIFEKYIWDNKDVIIYSYNRDLLPSEAKVIYRGMISSKLLDDSKANFTIKDYLKLLDKSVVTERFALTDGVTEDRVGQYKRRVFGKVDGVQLQSLDMNGGQITLTGTLSGLAGSTSITGVGTNFLDELSPDDNLIISDTEFSVESIESDVALTLSEESTVELVSATIEAKLSTPYQAYNRKWYINSNVLNEPSTAIVIATSTTNFTVADSSIFRVGDSILIDTVIPQQRFISRIISSDDLIFLETGLDTVPTSSNIVTRPPVQKLYYDKREVPSSYYTVTNTPSEGCYVTFTNTFERDFAVISSLNTETYIKAADDTRKLYVNSLATEQPDIELKSRDFIKFPTSGWFEVMTTDDNFIIIRDPMTTGYSGVLKIKRTFNLNDDSIVSADLYGETVDQTATGEWIKTSPKLYKTLLIEAGYEDLLDTESFNDLTEDSIIGVISPESFGDDAAETLKDLILRVNNSTNSVLTVDNELRLKYLNYNSDVDFDDIINIDDHDIISWKPKATAPKLFSDFSVAYNLKDINYLIEDEGKSFYTFENEFVDTYVGVEKTKNDTYYIHDDSSVRANTQRQAFLSTLTSSTYTINSDLRYANLEIGNIVRLDFLNVVGFTGNNTKKLTMVIGISKKDDSVVLTVTDLGQLYSRRCIITPDTAPDWDSATDDEKLIYGYITQDNGLQDDDETTFGRDLIF